MKKILLIVLLLVSSLLVCQAAFAVDLHFRDFFQIAPHDTSLVLLQMAFGKVGTVLNVSPALFGAMFAEFNRAVLALATIVIMYTVVTSIINTAHQGEFLGRKLNSMWVPLRSVAGFVLIVPTPSGYSLIQIFMMWVVVQGIGAADQLWKTTINYIVGSGGAIVASGSGAMSMVGNDIPAMTKILQNSVCLHRAYKSQNIAFWTLDHLAQVIFSGLTMTPADDGSTPIEGSDGWYYGTGIVPCGGFTVKGKEVTLPGGTKMNLTNTIKEGLRSGPIDAMDSLAKLYIYQGKGVAAPTSTEVAKQLIASVIHVQSKLKNVMDTAKAKKNVTQGVWKDAIDYGWANAGAYYRRIASMNNAFGGGISFSKDLIFVPSNGPALLGGDSNFVNQAKQKANENLKLTPPVDSNAVGNISSGFVGSIAGLVIPQFKHMLSGGLTTPTDPLIMIQSMGSSIVNFVFIVWAALVALSLLMAIPAGICSGESPAFLVMLTLLKFTVIPLMAVMGTLLMAGLSMAIHVPMIPYIIFTFGVIGWLIAVVETMIAAPLVALGITHPEGHDIYGRAEPAVQLLVNVFLRPTFMIFGMMAGMLLSRISVAFVNSMYAKVVNSMGHNDGIYAVMYLVIYVSLVISILNRCFSLIHLIPDRVLSWIGNQSQFGQYAAGEEGVKGGFQAGAKATTEAAQGVAQGMAKEGLERGEAKAKGAGKDGAADNDGGGTT